MKIKKKGKVHPSPSPSSSDDRQVVVLSVLNLLPAAILALATVLSLDDREVLAYMLTRSLKTTSSSSSSSSSSTKKKVPSKKAQTSTNNGVHGHGHNKPPMFECECFDCYTSFWVRWDNSPNRDLIHRVIEAFEDHLTSGETSHRPNKKRSRSDKLARRDAKVSPPPPEEEENEAAAVAAAATTAIDVGEETAVVSGPLPGVENGKAGSDRENDAVMAVAEDDDVAVVLRSMAAASGSEHRGLARKVLPDVLGLLNSRLWSLWSPNA